MKTFKIYIYTLAAFIWVAACKPSFDSVPAPSKGSADFTRYIALGNSLTAGYADGGLYLTGQLNSFPGIIAQQMQTVGGGSFTQPLFTPDQASGTGYQKITGFNADGTPVISGVAATAIRGSITLPGLGTIPLFTKYTGAIDNYGVPGIKVNDVLNPAYGNGNPYYERLLPNNTPTNTTAYLDFATAKPYTFFTSWLGNDDALSYATNGGASDALTDRATFNANYNALINRLTAAGQKGAVATVPDVTTLPYFTTVTVGAVLAGVQKVVPTVQAIYINAATNNAASTYAPRPATATDLIVLTFQAQVPQIGKPTIVGGVTTNPYPYGLDPRNPIESKYVLDPNEVGLIQDYVSSYNSTIKSVAAAKGIAVFDAYTFLTNVKTSGLVVNGISFNSNFVSGGLFSLDGIHLTPRGYAIVANEFIKVINSQYGSTIPIVNVGNYNGIIFP